MKKVSEMFTFEHKNERYKFLDYKICKDTIVAEPVITIPECLRNDFEQLDISKKILLCKFAIELYEEGFEKGRRNKAKEIWKALYMCDPANF